MHKEAVKNMTSGNPTKLIISFAIPLLLGNIFQQLYNMVDTVIVGRFIGVNALAAVGSTGSINFLVLGFVLGLTQGLSILVAQYYGADNYKKIRKSITMSIYLYAIVGIIITVISVIYSRELLEILRTPDNIINDAHSYIRIIFAGIIVTIAFNFLSGILRALGDGKTPLYSLFISSIINIVLDIYFIVVLRMGVNGAAYATVIAQLISSIFCYYKIHKIKEIRIHKDDWKFNGALFKKSFILGIPVALMNSVTAVGVMVLQVVVNGYGAVYVAGYSAGSRVIIILEQVGNTFGFAIATYAGQNLGANKIDRIKEGVRNTNVILFVINIALGVLVVLFGKQVLALIVSGGETEVISIGYQYLVVTSLLLWVLGLLFVYRSTLQAIGDTFIPMISGIVEFAARIGTVIILASLFGFIAIPAAEVAAWAMATIILMITYYYRIRKFEENYKSEESA